MDWKVQILRYQHFHKDDLTLEANAENKIEGLFDYFLLMRRLKHQDSEVNKITNSAIITTNG